MSKSFAVSDTDNKKIDVVCQIVRGGYAGLVALPDGNKLTNFGWGDFCNAEQDGVIIHRKSACAIFLTFNLCLKNFLYLNHSVHKHVFVLCKGLPADYHVPYSSLSD